MLNNLTLNYIISGGWWKTSLEHSIEAQQHAELSVEVKTLPTYVVVLIKVFFIMRIVSYFQKGKVKFYYHE
jgi:hypothetical protein